MGGIYDDRGNYQGSIRSSGEIYDEYGNYLGRITKDGEIYDASGTYQGAIWSNGHIYIGGTYVGLIDESGYVYKNGSYVGHVDGLKKNKIDPSQQSSGRIESQGSHNNQESSSGRKTHINIPTSVGDGGCLPTIIIGTLIVVGIIYVAVYAIVIAAIIGMAVACIALVGWIFYMIVGAATKGKFKENPNAKVISGISATTIVLCAFAIMHYSGSLDKLTGSESSSGTTYQGSYYDDGSDDSYDAYDSGDDYDGIDDAYESYDDSYDESDDSEPVSYYHDDYILPNSDSEYLTKEDLEDLTSEELRLARNEIYARHGRRFNDATLQSYFDACSWYNGTIDPDDFSENVLNQYEKKNLDKIVNYEKK